jgi:HlyD family secretion protein
VKRGLLLLLLLGVVSAAGFTYYRYNRKAPAPTVTTGAVTRGDVVDTVGATGTLQALTTVQVGTQVSGTIEALYADFNSLVKKGQVLARLDPSLFQTQIEQARANLIRAQADLDRLKVSLEDAKVKLTRAQELSGRQLIPQSDLETAQVNARSIDAQIRSSEAQVTQARASLNQNQVNLDHTIIAAPIDGLVISRNVDVGQTVAASMQAPTLFILAADLTKMQVVANLDESDVGRIRPGQHVTFRVDAYPAEDFSGAVAQVRLQPIVQQNVVTYATVIEVPNPGLKLKPGMTANVNIEINRRANVLRIPNAGLRFRPTNEIFAALNQPAPDPAQLRGFGPDGAGRGRGRGGAAAPSLSADQAPAQKTRVQPAPDAPKASTDAPASAPGIEEGDRRAGRGGGAGAGRGGGAGRNGGAGLAERLQAMSPEDRARAVEELRARGIDPDAPGARTAPEGRGTAGDRRDAPRAGRGAVPSIGQSAQPAAPGAASAPAATTFDALFAPLPSVESAGRVWVYKDNQLTPLRVRTGVSDGQNTELVDGELEEGTEVVTNVIVAAETRPAPGAGGFPGLGQQQRGGFPGGGGNRGGGGGGNNRGGGGR